MAYLSYLHKLSVLALCFVLISCSKEILEHEAYPDWWSYIHVEDVNLKTKADVVSFWHAKSANGDLPESKRVMYKREFFKAAYLAIRHNALDDDAKILALQLMPDEKIEVELRRSIYLYNLDNYWNYEKLSLDCINCEAATFLAISTVGLAEIYAWHDNNKTTAINLIQKLVREKRFSLNENSIIKLYKTAADIYLRRGMGEKDREFMRHGYEYISSLPSSFYEADYERFLMAFHRLRDICC